MPRLASCAITSLLLFACSAPPPASASCSPDTLYPGYVEAATPSPDGEGWCCQPGAPTCGCGYFGGFVRDRCNCGAYATLEPSPFGACDLAPPDWIVGTDAHGCMAYHAALVTTACCNCPDTGPRDGGASDDSSP